MEHRKNRDNEDILKAKYPKLYDAIFTNSTTLNSQILLSSLFIMSFEAMQDYVVDRFQEFFCHDFEFGKDGKVIYKESDQFAAIKEKFRQQYQVLSNKFMGLNTKRVSLFQAACAWLHEIECFNENDIRLILAIIQVRNQLTHELFQWLLDDQQPYLVKGMVYSLLNLYFKASNWWIREYEASIFPENFTQYSEEDMTSAAAANVFVLHALLDKCFPTSSADSSNKNE